MDPIYAHDCPNCQFLGTFNDADMYFCDQHMTNVLGDTGPWLVYRGILTGGRRAGLMPRRGWHVITNGYPMNPDCQVSYTKALAEAGRRGIVCKCDVDKALFGLKLDE